MKYKIAVLSLLITTLGICLFTSYTLINKTNKQLELQKIQLEIEIEQFELENNIIYYNGQRGTGTWVNDATRRSDYWRSEINRIYNTN